VKRNAANPAFELRCGVFGTKDRRSKILFSERNGFWATAPRDVSRDLRKSRSSPLKHIFSTIPAFTPPSTQNRIFPRSWLGSGCRKNIIRAQSSFSEFPGISILLMNNGLPEKIEETPVENRIDNGKCHILEFT
jgi:hypothetical protein